MVSGVDSPLNKSIETTESKEKLIMTQSNINPEKIAKFTINNGK
jgi:hypothetical protein